MQVANSENQTDKSQPGQDAAMRQEPETLTEPKRHSPRSNQALLRSGRAGAMPPQPPLRPSQTIRLQRKCACGNPSVAGGECEECKAKKGLGLQTKLTINEPGDSYEQEADRVAEQVMAAPLHSAVSAVPPRIQRYAASSTTGADMAPASVDQALASSGSPLEPALRQDMEQRFGHDLSQVRIHTGVGAEKSARDLNANAYTAGQNIVFGMGQFAPGTYEGRRLLAHELTHVVQQSGGNRVYLYQGNEMRTLPCIKSELQDTANFGVIRRQPGGGGKQRASSKKTAPVWEFQRSAETPNEIRFEFSEWIFEYEVLPFLFTDGKLPPGFKLESTSNPTTRWKLTLPLGVPTSEGVGKLRTAVLNRIMDPYYATLSLTPEETASYRERVDRQMDTYLDFLGMTAREALEKYPITWWGKKGGYFIYIGFDTAESRNRILTAYPMSADKVINSDIEFWLSQGHTLREALEKTEQQWRSIVIQAISAYASVLASAPGGAIAGSAPIAKLDIGMTVGGTVVSAYYAWKSALESHEEPGAMGFKESVQRMKISLGKPGGLKEVASKVHGLRNELKGQAVAIVKVKIGNEKFLVAGVNSGAGWGQGWTEQQRVALKALGVIVVEPIGTSLVHAEANVRAWISEHTPAGVKAEVIQWGISAGEGGAHICSACRGIIEILGGTTEEFGGPRGRALPKAKARFRSRFR